MHRLKLMLVLAVGAASLAAVWAGGAVEADDDRFLFADCPVEFTLQNGWFVAVDGRSWLEVDPAGECHETAENDESSADDESAGGEGDDSSVDDGGDDSRSAPAGSASDEANQQDDSAGSASSADEPSEPTSQTDSPVGAVDDPAPQAQEQQVVAFLIPSDCTDAAKPETGPALVSLVDSYYNFSCAIVRGGGAVQVWWGDYTLSLTLPAGRDWDAKGWTKYSGNADGAFVFSDHTTGGRIVLNPADGAELDRRDSRCEHEQIIVEETVRIAEDGTVHSHTTYEYGDDIVCTPLEEGFPALLDAIAASTAVPAAASGSLVFDPSCPDWVKLGMGLTVVRLPHHFSCGTVLGGGAVQVVSRGNYTLNATLPAGRDWRVMSYPAGNKISFTDAATDGWVELSAADGAEIERYDCRDWFVLHPPSPDPVKECRPLEEGFPALLDAIVASATVPAAAE